jgi:hypothetical protein
LAIKGATSGHRTTSVDLLESAPVQQRMGAKPVPHAQKQKPDRGVQSSWQ